MEEILDWRPYDYVTDLTVLDTPIGARAPHTDRVRAQPPAHDPLRSPAEEEEEWPIAEQIGAAYGEALRLAVPRLLELLDEEVALREADRGPEAGPGRAKA